MSPTPLPDGAFVKNTFLEFADEEDPWFVSANPIRQKTDSLVDRSSQSLRLQLEQSLLDAGRDPVATTGPGLATGLGEPQSIIGGRAVSGLSPLTTVSASAIFSRPKTLSDLPLPAVPGAWSGKGGHFASQPGFQQNKTALQPRVLEEEDPTPMRESSESCSRPGSSNDSDHEEQRDDAEGDEADEQENDAAPEGGEGGGDNDALDASQPATRALPSAEILRAREVAERGGGLSGCTTVMVRHVPSKYTQRKLMREINNSGFLGQYDFFYLPMDPRSHANRGFAFINFMTVEAAEDFYHCFHGHKLQYFNAEAPIAIMPADLQGFDSNAVHYASSRAGRHKRTLHSRPLFFRPLPEHLTDARNDAVLAESLGTPAPAVSSFSAPQLPTVPWPMAQAAFMWPSPPVEPAMIMMGMDRQKPQPVQRQRQQRLSPELPLQAAQTLQAPPQMRQAVQQQPMASAPAEAQASQPRFCAFCGEPKEADFPFCPFCGKKAVC